MYARSREQAEAVAAELTREHGVEAAAFACDITDGAAVEQLVAAVTARFGRLDILVNDAAYNKAIPFPDLDGLTIEEWDRIIAVNLTRPIRLIQTVAPTPQPPGSGRHVQNAPGAGPIPPTRSTAGA